MADFRPGHVYSYGATANKCRSIVVMLLYVLIVNIDCNGHYFIIYIIVPCVCVCVEIYSNHYMSIIAYKCCCIIILGVYSNISFCDTACSYSVFVCAAALLPTLEVFVAPTIDI